MPAENAVERRYRLPTEAQWEYACRAGSTGRFSFSSDRGGIPKESAEQELFDYGWFNGNDAGRLHAVGGKRPNAWGLYDMHGDVWEWCHDWYSKNYYANSPTDDPSGPSVGSYRVDRGGAWFIPAGDCRSAIRDSWPWAPASLVGFRVVLVPTGTAARPAASSAVKPPQDSLPPPEKLLLPPIVFGEWIPLLTSPDQLVGWDPLNENIRYSNRTIEVRIPHVSDARIGYPVIARDVRIRARAKILSGQNIGLFLRRSDRGSYAAWFGGGRQFGIGKNISDSDGFHWINLVAGTSPQSCDGFFDFEFSAIGDALTLSVNGQLLLATHDSSHTEGAVFVGGMGNGLFTDVALLIPTKESLVADHRRPPRGQPPPAVVPVDEKESK
jgi:hypothetical protein